MEKMELRSYKKFLIAYSIPCALIALSIGVNSVLMIFRDRVFDMGALGLFFFSFICVIGVFTFKEDIGKSVTIDEEGIKTNKWGVRWEDVVRCYIDYGFSHIPKLTVVRRGRVPSLTYDMRWMKYGKYEMGHFIDKMAGRNVFDINKSVVQRDEDLADCIAILLCVGVAFGANFILKTVWVGIVVGVVLWYPLSRALKKVLIGWEMKKWEKEN